MPGDKVLRLPSYGGQAVMEGVLMRGKRNVAMAVRVPDREWLFDLMNLKLVPWAVRLEVFVVLPFDA